MAEVTAGEYYAKVNERDMYLARESSCKSQIAVLEREIEELDRAIDQMTIVYQYFKSQVASLNGIILEKREFKGNQEKKLIDGKGGELLSEAERCRDHVMNYALDQLMWLRQQKRAQRNEHYGVLGRIQSHLSYLWTWLNTNFFNN